MEEKKTRQIHLRVSEEQEKKLKEKAKIWGGSMSSFILEASLKYNEIHGANRIQIMNEWANRFSEYKYEMEKIGTNINQIAHVLNIMNRQGNLSLSRDMLEKISDYNQLVKEMKILEEKIFKQMIKRE